MKDTKKTSRVDLSKEAVKHKNILSWPYIVT